MKHCFTSVIILIYASSILLSQPTILAQNPSQVALGYVSGHVWLDSDCDGIKESNESNVIHAGVVQVVNTGADRILNKGDMAQTYYTDSQGYWKTNQMPVNDFDNQPLLFAVAVGEGSAATLGYKVSPSGGDSILSGSNHASPTFQLQGGVTLQIGEIGLCPLSANQSFKVYLPTLQH